MKQIKLSLTQFAQLRIALNYASNHTDTINSTYEVFLSRKDFRKLEKLFSLKKESPNETPKKACESPNKENQRAKDGAKESRSIGQ